MRTMPATGADFGHAHGRNPPRQVGHDGLRARRHHQRRNFDGLFLRGLRLLPAAPRQEGKQA
ncbi:hypothetical protein WJ967_20160 [Achromobacter xylosoxidans]